METRGSGEGDYARGGGRCLQGGPTEKKCVGDHIDDVRAVGEGCEGSSCDGFQCSLEQLSSVFEHEVEDRAFRNFATAHTDAGRSNTSYAARGLVIRLQTSLLEHGRRRERLAVASLQGKEPNLSKKESRLQRGHVKGLSERILHDCGASKGARPASERIEWIETSLPALQSAIVLLTARAMS